MTSENHLILLTHQFRHQKLEVLTRKNKSKLWNLRSLYMHHQGIVGLSKESIYELTAIQAMLCWTEEQCSHSSSRDYLE